MMKLSLLLLLCWVAHSTVAVLEGDLRLANTSGRFGLLEVYIRGEWGTVCDTGFGRREVGVACTQMGYTSFSNYRRLGNVMDFGLIPVNSSIRIWLNHVDCGIPLVHTHLLACGHSGAGVVAGCTHSQDVVLECSGPLSPPEISSPRTGDLRLFGSSSGDIGRLEIYFSRGWGSVCGQGFQRVEADVACRQLGFSSATKFSLLGSDLGVFTGSRFLADRWLDITQCGPSDQTLLSCAHRPADTMLTCTNFQEIFLECASINDEGDLRLVGNGFLSDRLEIYLLGEWGTVCSRGFDEAEAEVACKQLGYSAVQRFGPANLIHPPPFSPNPPVNIWLNNVDCGCGDEELLSCDHSGIGEGVADCTHAIDVALACSDIISESAIFCPGDSTSLISAAVSVSISIILVVICTIICISVVAKKSRRRHRPPISTTALSDRVYHSQTLQSQQAPPSHSQQALPSQSFQEKILQNSTLQEAPPPAYEQGITYPSPSAPKPPPPPYQSCTPQDTMIKKP